MWACMQDDDNAQEFLCLLEKGADIEAVDTDVSK